MNAEEFVLWAKELGGVNNIPDHPFKHKWEKVYKDIEPHFYGEVPKILRTTFPNEDPAIYDYRKKTYQPKTESCITESVNKLSRLMQDSKYSINYEDENTKNYFDNDLKVQGQTFQQFFLSKFPSKRALDPNGVFLADVTGEGVNRSDIRVELDFKFIESKYIKLVDLDLGILIYRAPTYKNKYKAVQSLANTGVSELTNYRWYVVTDEFYGYIEIGGQDSSKLVQVYEHSFGSVPFVIMGGRPLSEDYNGFQFYYFKSDLSSAIPFLNDAAVSDNQEKSTTMANAFPVKIIQGIDCNDCGGDGFAISPPDEEHPDGKRSVCGTCKGTGQLTLSPLNGIYTKKKPKYGAEDQTDDGPLLEYVSPNVGILDYLSGYSEKKYEQAKEILNIEKAVKYAQSAIAKEVDNEPEHIEVKRISDDVFYRLNYMMLIIQYLVLNDESSIFLIPPTSFDIKNEAELFQEYKETISSKSPDFVRAAAFEDWLKQRFSTDKAGQKIAKICIGYAKAFLMTSEEQERYYLMGVYERQDLIKASSVYNIVINEYNKSIDFINQDLEAIYTQIDNILRPILDSATALPPPNVDPEEL